MSDGQQNDDQQQALLDEVAELRRRVRAMDALQAESDRRLKELEDEKRNLLIELQEMADREIRLEASIDDLRSRLRVA